MFNMLAQSIRQTNPVFRPLPTLLFPRCLEESWELRRTKSGFAPDADMRFMQISEAVCEVSTVVVNGYPS